MHYYLLQLLLVFAVLVEVKLLGLRLLFLQGLPLNQMLVFPSVVVLFFAVPDVLNGLHDIRVAGFNSFIIDAIEFVYYALLTLADRPPSPGFFVDELLQPHRLVDAKQTYLGST